MSDGGKAKGKGNSENQGSEAKKDWKPPPVLSKRRTLELITSLAEDDDERAAISKKISWILRHGAQRVGCSRNEDGFVKISDLRKVEIMEEVTEEKLMSVIAESNAQKPRYELKESPDGKLIRAIKKDERKAMRSGAAAAPAAAPEAGRPISLASATPMRSEAPAFVPSVGKPAAAPAYGAYSPMANPWAAAGFFPPQMQYQMMAAAQAAQAAQASGGGASGASAAKGSGPGGANRYHGKIKSFNDEKGFGFIESPQAQAHFGRDVFLHKAMIGDLKVGMDVNFTVESNKQGMPQARDVKAAGAGGTKGAKTGADKGKGGRGGKSAKGKGKGAKGAKSEEASSDKKEPVAPGEQPASGTTD